MAKVENRGSASVLRVPPRHRNLPLLLGKRKRVVKVGLQQQAQFGETLVDSKWTSHGHARKKHRLPRQ